MKGKQKKELTGEDWGENIQQYRANEVTAEESKWTNQFALTSYQDEDWKENNFDFNMADFLDCVLGKMFISNHLKWFSPQIKGIVAFLMTLPVFQIFSSKQTSSHHTRDPNPNEFTILNRVKKKSSI